MDTLDPGQREKLLQTGLRRVAWPAGIVAVTVVTAWIADSGVSTGAQVMWSTWESVDVTGFQAAWTTLSIAGVLAVYWWGVGTGSRYEPPPVSSLQPVEIVATTTTRPSPD